MTQWEKLIELIINAKRTDPETGSFTEYIADYLLDNGVILPTCKVGGTVYCIDYNLVDQVVYAVSQNKETLWFSVRYDYGLRDDHPSY